MKRIILSLFSMSIAILGISQTITDTGDKVGIGTTLPQGKLHIKNYGDGAVVLNLETERGWQFRQTGIGAAANLELYNNIGLNKHFIINTQGNVGIGTTLPQGKLHIKNYGDGAVLLNLETERGWQFRQTGIGAAANLELFNNIGLNKHFIINTQGNIGIGTINPQSKLAVNGTITSKEVKVTLEGWSDFVFDETYELKDLEEVENFIDENNHLPDVPSEKEVLENGIALGEMDATLLQKIEELTLYMIEQNKMINELIEEVQGLKVENKTLKKEINTLKAQ